MSVADPDQRTQFVVKLREESVGSFEMLLLPLATTVVPFAALFYGYFLFDMYGDQVGAIDAIWVMVLTACMPLIIAIVYRMYCHFTHRSPSQWNGEDRKVFGNDGRSSTGGAVVTRRQSDIEMPIAAITLPEDKERDTNNPIRMW